MHAALMQTDAGIHARAYRAVLEVQLPQGRAVRQHFHQRRHAQSRACLHDACSGWQAGRGREGRASRTVASAGGAAPASSPARAVLAKAGAGRRTGGQQPHWPPAPASHSNPGHPTQLQHPTSAMQPTWSERRSRQGQRSTSCCSSAQLLSCRSVSSGRPSARQRRRVDRLMRSSRRPASTVATGTNCWAGAPSASAPADPPLQPDRAGRAAGEVSAWAAVW